MVLSLRRDTNAEFRRTLPRQEMDEAYWDARQESCSSRYEGTLAMKDYILPGKLCSDCKYYFFDSTRLWSSVHQCTREESSPSIVRSNPVIGKVTVIKKYLDCHDMRATKGPCGPGGKLFSPTFMRRVFGERK